MEASQPAGAGSTTIATMRAHARSIRQRLRTPRNGINSTEFDIVPSQVFARRRAFAIEAAEEARRRAAERQKREAQEIERKWNEALVHFIETCPQIQPVQRPKPENSTVRTSKVREIARVVCRFYGVSLADLIGSRRTANVIRPRHVAYYLARTLTIRSLPEIGKALGGRDHTTILHGYIKIKAALASDEVLATDVAYLRSVVTGEAS